MSHPLALKITTIEIPMADLTRALNWYVQTLNASQPVLRHHGEHEAAALPDATPRWKHLAPRSLPTTADNPELLRKELRRPAATGHPEERRHSAGGIGGSPRRHAGRQPIGGRAQRSPSPPMR